MLRLTDFVFKYQNKKMFMGLYLTDFHQSQPSKSPENNS